MLLAGNCCGVKDLMSSQNLLQEGFLHVGMKQQPEHTNKPAVEHLTAPATGSTGRQWAGLQHQGKSSSEQRKAVQIRDYLHCILALLQTK